MNLGNSQSSESFDNQSSDANETLRETLNGYINKKTITITAMSALALGGVFLATNVEAQESIRTTVNEVSVSAMKTRHSSDFENKDVVQSDETIQKESSLAMGGIAATWTDNSVEEIKTEIERQRELGLPAYVVQWGDTLSVLAEALGVSVDYLVDLNNISDRHLILTGDILVGVLANDMIAPAGSESTETERTISQEELDRLLEQEEIEQIIKEMDTDGDGVISIEEALAAGIELPIDSDHWLYPYMKDVNEDGVIDGKDIVAAYDKDGDGKLSPDELGDAGLTIDREDPSNDWINDYLDDDESDDNPDDNDNADNNDDDDPNDNLDDDSDDNNDADDNLDDNDGADNNEDDDNSDDDDVTDDAPNVNDDDNSDDDADAPDPNDDNEDPTDVGEPDDETPDGPVIEHPDEDDVDPDDDSGIVIIDPDEDDEDDEFVYETGRSNVVSTQDIPYGTEEVDDPNLDAGEREVDTPGMVGTLETTVILVTYSDGSEEVVETVSETVISEPITEVIRVGTRAIIDPDDESLFTTEEGIINQEIDFGTTYDPDPDTPYGEPVLLTPGVTGFSSTLIRYTLNGLGEVVDEQILEENFEGEFDGVERYYIPAENQIVRINPEELAEIEAGDAEPPRFDVTPAPDPENSGDDDLDTAVKTETDEDGNVFEYTRHEQEEISSKPMVTDIDDALALDPTFDPNGDLLGQSSLVGYYKPFVLPVLANEPINLTQVSQWLGREIDVPDGMDLSPLEEDEQRVVIESQAGEATVYRDIYYLDDDVVYTSSEYTVYSDELNSGKYFIGKPQSFLDQTSPSDLQ